MKLKKHFAIATKLTTLLDTKFKFFGVRFGLDPLLDFIPGLGSIIGGITSCYIFWIASKLDVPGKVYFRMSINILLDLILGEIPIVGIFLDIFYKSNVKNLRLLEKYFDKNIIEGEIIA